MKSERKKTKLLPCGRPLSQDEKSPALDEGKRWRDSLSAYLQDKRLKQSDARYWIVEAILALAEEGHFSVSGLVKKVQQSHPQIGTATVYRNLPLLLDLGLIGETLRDEEGQMIYEIAGDAHHDHIVCMDCHRIFEFHEEVIEDAQDRLSRKMRFRPTKHRHVIYARCEYRDD